MDNTMSSCWLCGAGSNVLCQDCGLVSSCDESHMSLHRSENSCRPFIVKRNNSVGRYMVATRDIHPLETILVESPFCVGPCRDGQLVCVECLCIIDEVRATCHTCRLPVCGDTSCQETVRHHQAECDYIASSGWTWSTPDQLSSLLEALTTIRMMSKIKQLKKQPDDYSSALFELSVGNGDIPEIDDKVLQEAQAVMKQDFEKVQNLE